MHLQQFQKGTYKTSKKDVTTFGVMASVVTSEAVPEDLVYAVVKAVLKILMISKNNILHLQI